MTIQFAVSVNGYFYQLKTEFSMDQKDISSGVTFISTPLGLIKIIAEGGAITGIYFSDETDVSARSTILHECLLGESATDEKKVEIIPEILLEAASQLMSYFEGRLKTFDLQLHLKGTDFQLSVWNLLLQIPYGCTTTYGEIAGNLGLKNGARAVGLANGSNPVSIVVPCHRVIGQSGKLTGYGGGLWRKEWLLKRELQALDKGLFKK